jgi:hypothetical protein
MMGIPAVGIGFRKIGNDPLTAGLQLTDYQQQLAVFSKGQT